MYIMLIFKKKKRGSRLAMPPQNKNQKTYFEMMKITKSNPVFKRNGVKTELYIYSPGSQ